MAESFIHVGNGKRAVVDSCLLFEPLTMRREDGLITLRICDHSWGFCGKRGREHVAKIIEGRNVMLHRLILQAMDERQVDHINGNPLDNRLENLRFATNQQNARNMRSKGGSSRFKGVSFQKTAKSRPWIARIMLDGRDVRRKAFATETEAALQYDEWAAELFGEFAWLNSHHFLIENYTAKAS